MGAGASLAAELPKASQDQVASSLTDLGAEDRTKVLTAIALVESDGALGKETHAEKAEDKSVVEPMDPGKIKGPISLAEVADTVIGNLMSGEPVLRLPREACKFGLRTQIAKALQIEPERVLLFQDGQKLENDILLDLESIVVQVLPAPAGGEGHPRLGDGGCQGLQHDLAPRGDPGAAGALLVPERKGEACPIHTIDIKVSDRYEEYTYHTGWFYSLLVKPSAPDQLEKAHAERMHVCDKGDDSSCSHLCDMSSEKILDRLRRTRCWRKLVEDPEFAKLQEIIHQTGSGRGFDWDLGSYDGFFIEVAGHIIEYTFSSWDDG